MPAGRARTVLLQALLLALLVALAALLVASTAEHLRERGIRSGFDFLWQEAGFSLSETVFPFSADDSALQAFIAGWLNTLRVAIPAALLALLLGLLVGFSRLSRNFLLRSLARLYVEAFRNVPLLLLLLACYFVLTDVLPPADQALKFASGFYLSKAGFALPWWVDGALELPQPGRFGLEGGARLTPEYLAMLCGLLLYTAAYIAETIRASVQALPVGQTWAARALGMTPLQVFRLVLLPQAWRAALPPITSQLLNLFKNASLAVVIGYPDLVSVAGTTLNQTGRAIECIVIVIGVYLTLSLLLAALSRFLERRNLRAALP